MDDNADMTKDTNETAKLFQDVLKSQGGGQQVHPVYACIKCALLKAVTTRGWCRHLLAQSEMLQ